MNDENMWVLMVEHRHGTDVSIHRTEQGAKDALTVYVDYWWGREFPGAAAPADDNERVTEYFERIHDEFHTINEAPVLP